jgi:hypothetical protein
MKKNEKPRAARTPTKKNTTSMHPDRGRSSDDNSDDTDTGSDAEWANKDKAKWRAKIISSVREELASARQKMKDKEKKKERPFDSDDTNSGSDSNPSSNSDSDSNPFGSITDSFRTKRGAVQSKIQAKRGERGMAFLKHMSLKAELVLEGDHQDEYYKA